MRTVCIILLYVTFAEAILNIPAILKGIPELSTCWEQNGAVTKKYEDCKENLRNTKLNQYGPALQQRKRETDEKEAPSEEENKAGEEGEGEEDKKAGEETEEGEGGKDDKEGEEKEEGKEGEETEEKEEGAEGEETEEKEEGAEGEETEEKEEGEEGEETEEKEEGEETEEGKEEEEAELTTMVTSTGLTPGEGEEENVTAGLEEAEAGAEEDYQWSTSLFDNATEGEHFGEVDIGVPIMNEPTPVPGQVAKFCSENFPYKSCVEEAWQALKCNKEKLDVTFTLIILFEDEYFAALCDKEDVEMEFLVDELFRLTKTENRCYRQLEALHDICQGQFIIQEVGQPGQTCPHWLNALNCTGEVEKTFLNLEECDETSEIWNTFESLELWKNWFNKFVYPSCLPNEGGFRSDLNVTTEVQQDLVYLYSVSLNPSLAMIVLLVILMYFLS